MTLDLLSSLEKMVKIEGLIKKSRDPDTKALLREELARIRQAVNEARNTLNRRVP